MEAVYQAGTDIPTVGPWQTHTTPLPWLKFALNEKDNPPFYGSAAYCVIPPEQLGLLACSI